MEKIPTSGNKTRRSYSNSVLLHLTEDEEKLTRNNRRNVIFYSKKSVHNNYV